MVSGRRYLRAWWWGSSHTAFPEMSGKKLHYKEHGKASAVALKLWGEGQF